MIAALQLQVDTLEKLKKGETPDIPVVTPAPVVIREPEVHTVEVQMWFSYRKKLANKFSI